MRIALVSFEFPPSVAIGGIGAYASEAARMLVDAGHDVEVFSAGAEARQGLSVEGAHVHRVAARDRETFREAVVGAFAARHASIPFEVLESPEVGAEGIRIAEAHPEIPLVVKLHTPSYLVEELSYEPPTLAEQIRFTVGGLRRGRLIRLRKFEYDSRRDIEANLARRADRVAAPCGAIADRVASDWSLARDKIQIFPLPFRPPDSLAVLPLPRSVQTIGFLGRLEPRKGVIELSQAIPEVLAACPQLHFRMLGPSWPYRYGDMQGWMRQRLRSCAEAVEFIGAVDRDQLATELERCDAIVLPSRWENFPFACWESLAAGRVVIGSSAGGMAEVIRDGVDGRLVPPYTPKAIASTLIELATNTEGIARMAASGRARVQTLLCPEAVLDLQMACYKAAIAAKARKGTLVREGPCVA